MSENTEQLQLVDSQLPRPVRKRLKLEDLPSNEELLGPEPEPSFRQSIADFGQLVAIMVVEQAGGGYHVSGGRRRVKALRALEEKDVLADVYPEGSAADILTIVENEQRQENPATTYQAIKSLMKEHKVKDAREIGKALGIPANRVDRLMRLTTLVPALEKAFESGDISASAAFAAVKLPSEVQKDLEKQRKKDGKLTTKKVQEAQQVEVQKGVASLDEKVFTTPGPDANVPDWPLTTNTGVEYASAVDLWTEIQSAAETYEDYQLVCRNGKVWRARPRVTVDYVPWKDRDPGPEEHGDPEGQS